MILFSDLHLRPESEATCNLVLDRVFQIAQQHGEPIGFLGDFWNVRYQLPVFLLNAVRQRLHAWGKVTPVYILPGNHDQVDVNGSSALEVFQDIPGVTVFQEPTVHSTGTWLPYRKDPQVLVEWIKGDVRSPREVAFLHHGIVGASMNNGRPAGLLDGLAPADLPFQTVFCGHWHRHQQVGQCVYVGSQWQTKIDEAGQVKGVVRTLPGGSWEFIPVELGTRHHRLEKFGPQEIAAIRPGDQVRVPAGTSKKMLAALQALGADVYAAVEAQGLTLPRLGVAADAPLRVQAQKYLEAQVQEIPEGVTAEELMAAFDEIAGSA